jgi:hypothetical protein
MGRTHQNQIALRTANMVAWSMRELPESERELIRAALTRVSHLRERKARACRACGRVVPDTLPHFRYCSVTCRSRAYRERQRAHKAARDKGVG